MMKFPKYGKSYNSMVPNHHQPERMMEYGTLNKNMFKFILTVNRQPEIGWFLNGESS